VRVKLGVSHVSDAAALRRVLGGLPPAAFPVLIQQRIDGEGVGIFLLVWSGQLVAMFAHRRLAEKPPSGGVSVYCESVTADPDLVTRSRALLDRFGWQGAAMVEYKRDASTGTPYLMEVNGRFWGSLQLAIDAGADFPSLLAALALGDSVPARGAYRVGVRSRWWWGQVDHLLARARGKHSPLAPGTVSFARAAADAVLGPFRSRDRDGVFRFDDPRPFVRESILWILGE
jgi:predicted ATP-grasp superfamily ATP-dependent carboligase